MNFDMTITLGTLIHMIATMGVIGLAAASVNARIKRIDHRQEQLLAYMKGPPGICRFKSNRP